MTLKKVIPKDKSDVNFIHELSKYDIKEVKEVVPELLTWLQDYNWPVAKYMAGYLSNFSNEVSNEILAILKGNDDIWKYWIVFTLVLHSKVTPNKAIMKEVKRLAHKPTKSEKHEEVDEIAREAIAKYKDV